MHSFMLPRQPSITPPAPAVTLGGPCVLLCWYGNATRTIWAYQGWVSARLRACCWCCAVLAPAPQHPCVIAAHLARLLLGAGMGARAALDTEVFCLLLTNKGMSVLSQHAVLGHVFLASSTARCSICCCIHEQLLVGHAPNAPHQAVAYAFITTYYPLQGSLSLRLCLQLSLHVVEWVEICCCCSGCCIRYAAAAVYLVCIALHSRDWHSGCGLLAAAAAASCRLSMHVGGPKLQGPLDASGTQRALVRCMHATTAMHAPVWL
jgi:hypothetical protein